RPNCRLLSPKSFLFLFLLPLFCRLVLISRRWSTSKWAISEAWTLRMAKEAECTLEIPMVLYLVRHGLTSPLLPHHDLMQNNPLTATINGDNYRASLSHELSRTVRLSVPTSGLLASRLWSACSSAWWIV
ncbi:hypothetical protein B0J12DRAFT_390822, partial [Macrophomina phaseolina]